MADPSLFLPDPRTPSPNQSAPPSYSPTPLSQWLSQWQQRIRKSSYISLFYVSLHMCVSISLSLSVCLSACMYVCVSVCLHLFPFLNIISIAPAYLAPCVFLPPSQHLSLSFNLIPVSFFSPLPPSAFLLSSTLPAGPKSWSLLLIT